MRSKLYRIFISVCMLLACIPASAQKYFQQQVNYKIDVTLDDKNHYLRAFESIEYINNSPLSLDFIYFHLWPNAYIGDSTALGKQMIESGNLKLFYSEEEQRGFIDSLDFKVNGNSVKWEMDSANADICKVLLNEPLKSGEKITITTPFRVKIPEGIFSRLGHIDQSYQITQWYPKPAVYDLNGWHPIPYLNIGEFYSEFGYFDVAVTLPKNYVIGSSGNVVASPDEIEFMNELDRQTREKMEAGEFKKKDSKKKDSKSKPDLSFPASDPQMKTVRFKQTNVHDFAWFADKRYHVLKGEVILPASGKSVTTWSLFTNAEAHLWTKSPEYLHDAVFYYSKWIGDYPYEHVTAVDGSLSAGAGMEYPAVTVIGQSGNSFSLEVVIVHEVGHNWFYGILGSDERRYPWMDEGINSFYEQRYFQEKYPPEAGSKPKSMVAGLGKIGSLLGLDQFDHTALSHFSYLFVARNRQDQPIGMPAYEYSMANYGLVVYAKTAWIFLYLKDYLGEEVFDRCMKKYFEQWKFKHPQPKDLRNVFESETQKDLAWFFEDIINSNDFIDYKIEDVKKCKTNCPDGKYTVTLKNNGKINGPVPVTAFRGSKPVNTIWTDGFSGSRKVYFADTSISFFRIDPSEKIPDLYRGNNTMRTSGLFPGCEPLQIKTLAGIENPDKNQLFVTPVIGWNYYNGLMFGAVFNNGFLPRKDFEYTLMPLYSLAEKGLAGYGEIGYNFYPSGGLFQRIKPEFIYRNYAYSDANILTEFRKFSPELTFDIRKKKYRDKTSSHILVRSVNIIREVEFYSALDKDYYKSDIPVQINEAAYFYSNGRALNPYKASVKLQHGEGFVKTMVEVNYKISYPGKNKGLDIRFFTGKFIYENEASPEVYLQMSGNRDYMLDEVYLGRSEFSGVLGRQFSMNDGGFKNLALVSGSSDWLSAVNLSTSIPGKVPVRLFADLGYSSETDGVAYNTGISLSPLKGIFEIYFPVLMSSDLNMLSYSEKVRFTLNLHLLSPQRVMRIINIGL